MTMPTEFRFVVPGKPVSLNDSYERRSLKRGGRGLRRTKALEDFRNRVQMSAIKMLGHKSCPFEKDVILEAIPHFTREADAGAVSKGVQDALEGIFYPNDRSVLLAINWKGIADPIHPRTEVLVRTLTAKEREDRSIVLAIPSDIAEPFTIKSADEQRAKSKRLVPAVYEYGKKSASAVKCD